MPQQLIFTTYPAEELRRLVGDRHAIVITDSNCGPAVVAPMELPWEIIEIKAGEEHKTLESIVAVWQSMIAGGCTRHSVAINIGGGVVTDLGGFAAATFKRGIDFINMPTTVLGAVDAAVGGKTGIDFMGLKNEIGTFREAESVVVAPRTFATLPHREWLSGYTEMIKHGLLSSRDDFRRLLGMDPSPQLADDPRFMEALTDGVRLKSHIVAQDPHEKGVRRYLNLGHTTAHAIETLALRRGRPVAHGYAVAWGLVTALVLSHLRLGFPSDELHLLAAFVRTHYGTPPVECSDYPALLDIMSHDKKNPSPDRISFTLLRCPGEAEAGITVTPTDITAALDITRDLC